MTALLPERADAVEAVLISLDRDYTTVYGPDLKDWPKGVRGEYLEALRARRTMDREAHPVRPRKCSASRRRRHRSQLPWRIHQTAPGAVTILLTPVWTDTHGPMERVYVVTARNLRDDQIKLPVGGSRRLADLLQGAFPQARWDVPQSWRADTNQITAWRGAS